MYKRVVRILEDEKAIGLGRLSRFNDNLKSNGLPLNNWQANKRYKVGYTIIQDGKFYRCKTEHTSTTTFDAVKFDLVGGSGYGISNWTNSTLYSVGDLVVYGNGIYQCKTTHTSTTTFDDTKWTNLSIGYEKENLYTGTTFNTSTLTVTTSNSMLTKDFIIIKIAYSVDGTSVKMNKSYVLTPVIGEVHDFSYQESTTSYIALTGKILNNTTLQFNFTEAQNLTKFKIISIDSLSIGDKAGTTLYSDTPIGTIISYMGNNPPKDYLSCDGTVYNISDYQALADFINTEFGSYDFFGGDGTTTFSVPDLRGEFLRGTGTNSHTNQGSGANVGVHQDGTEHVNIIITDGNTISVPGIPTSSIYSGKADNEIDGNKSRNKYVGISDGSGTYQDYQKFTSRPTNTSVLYCIKYTNSNSPEKIDIWTANTSYSVGNIVIYNDKIYKCITANNDATFKPLNWVCLSATGEEDIGNITFGYELQSGYLPLDGSTYNRADYADLINWVTDNSLWASTSTDYGKFGTGDGTTTFTTPNFKGKFIECDNSTNVGNYTSAGLPNIKGSIELHAPNSDGEIYSASGAFSSLQERTKTGKYNSFTNAQCYSSSEFDASKSSSIYSDSVNTVQPESIKLIPQIKYRKPNKSLPVKAVRRTLFEGSVGNFTGLAQFVQINLLDDFTSYDVIGFYISVNLVGNKRYIYREVTKEQLLAVQNSSNHDDTVSFNWGYSNADDYCDILYNSTSSQLICNINKQIITKIVGIKYINENQYSTEEQLVGTWIDGKPLYQKTVEFTTPSKNSIQEYSYLPEIPFSSIDKIISVDGWCVRVDGWRAPILFNTSNVLFFSVDWHKSNQKIYFYVSTSDTIGTANQPATLTFRYTKTTD